MKFEAEIISEELLPSIRSIMAKRLSRDYGLTQEEIAARLEVTQPAVSQYLNDSRADKEIVKELKEDPQIDITLNDAAGKAARDEDFSPEISQAISNIRDKGLLKERFRDAKRL